MLDNSNSAQKIFNNSLLYVAGGVFTKAISFFLVPLYTYNMSAFEYGISTTVSSFIAMVSIVVLFSMENALMRFYSECYDVEKQRYVGTLICFAFINGLVVGIVLYLAAPAYMDVLFEGIDFYPIVFMGILSLAFTGVYSVYQTLLRTRQEGINFSINCVVYAVFQAVGIILFVVILKKGAIGMIASNLLTNVLFATYGIISLKKRDLVLFCLDTKLLYKSLKYSIPLIPHDIAFVIDQYAIKIVINKYIGYSVSGIFTLASQFSTIFNIVVTSVNLAFRPWFFEQMKHGDEGRKIIKEMTILIMALYSFCAVTISVFSKEIVIIMTDKEYYDAWKLVPAFILAQLITFIYYSHVQAILFNVKKSKFAMICSFAYLITDVIVAIALIEKYHIIAVLIGQIASRIVMAIMAVIISRKSADVDFGTIKMVWYIIVSVILIGIGYIISSLDIHSLIFTLAIKVLLIIVSFFSILFKYRKEYEMLLKGIISRRKNEE